MRSENQTAVGPIDLNLLVTFDAVMAERNLRRAAERLGRSQPAVSQAIARLRDLLGDRLFAKIATGVEPTPRAEALWREIRDPLRTIALAVDHRGFDPQEARGELVLALADDVQELCLADIFAALQAQAPRLALRAIETDHRTIWDMLQSGLADLAVSVAGPPPRALGARILGELPFVLLHRADQIAPRSLEDYLAARHVAVGFADRTRGYTDERLASLGHEREIVATTPRFASLPDLVRRSGALATLPRPIAEHYCRTPGLLTSPLPFELQAVPLRLGWHLRRRTDPLNEWARAIVAECVAHVHFDSRSSS